MDQEINEKCEEYEREYGDDIEGELESKRELVGKCEALLHGVASESDCLDLADHYEIYFSEQREDPLEFDSSIKSYTDQKQLLKAYPSLKSIKELKNMNSQVFIYNSDNRFPGEFIFSFDLTNKKITKF